MENLSHLLLLFLGFFCFREFNHAQEIPEDEGTKPPNSGFLSVSGKIEVGSCGYVKMSCCERKSMGNGYGVSVPGLGFLMTVLAGFVFV